MLSTPLAAQLMNRQGQGQGQAPDPFSQLPITSPVVGNPGAQPAQPARPAQAPNWQPKMTGNPDPFAQLPAAGNRGAPGQAGRPGQPSPTPAQPVDWTKVNWQDIYSGKFNVNQLTADDINKLNDLTGKKKVDPELQNAITWARNNLVKQLEQQGQGGGYNKQGMTGADPLTVQAFFATAVAPYLKQLQGEMGQTASDYASNSAQAESQVPGLSSQMKALFNNLDQRSSASMKQYANQATSGALTAPMYQSLADALSQALAAQQQARAYYQRDIATNPALAASGAGAVLSS